MRYGVFADVHANLEALRAVLGLFRREKIDRFLCCGDLVGYGPDPNECVDMVKALPHLLIVVGNHDWAACGMRDTTWFNEYARRAIDWTRETLTQENQIYLSELPKVARAPGITLVHGSPRGPLDDYLLTREQYEENLPRLSAGVTFLGHSHIPFIFGRDATLLLRDSGPVSLAPGEKYLVNAGSVGQPRDVNPRASCGIYDSGNGSFSLHRIEYDVSKTQEKMYQARLPVFLIERLTLGK